MRVDIIRNGHSELFKLACGILHEAIADFCHATDSGGSHGKALADKELQLAWLFTNAGQDNANWLYALSRRRPKRSVDW